MLTKFLRCSYLIIGFLSFSTHQLPAPIVEEATPAPTAKPKPKAVAKQKSTSNSSQNSGGQKKETPIKHAVASPFAGTWVGTTNDSESNGATGTTSFVLTISADGLATAKWMTPDGTFSGVAGRCRFNGQTATWSAAANDVEGNRFQRSFLFILGGNNSASFRCNTSFVAGPLQGVTGVQTGVFTRQN